jgi:hypothetical protein
VSEGTDACDFTPGSSECDEGVTIHADTVVLSIPASSESQAAPAMRKEVGSKDAE